MVRIDGRGFHKYSSHGSPPIPNLTIDVLLTYARLSAKYEFQKPNDRTALELMNAAAVAVMKELTDINVAYGISDEFRFDALDCTISSNVAEEQDSFVFDRTCTLFQRRERCVSFQLLSHDPNFVQRLR